MTPKSPTTTRRRFSRIRPSKRLAALTAVVFAIAALVLAAGSFTGSDTALAAAVPAKVNGPSVVVASLNIAMVTDSDAIVKEISEHPVLRDADVFLMQEVVETKDHRSVADEIGAKLGRSVEFASPEDVGGPATFSGIAILSKSTLADRVVKPLPRQNLVFRSRKRIALAGYAETPAGRLRVVTAHLDTRINPAQRVRQLEPALDEARRGSPAVVGGDFNTNDMEWVSNVVPVPWPGWQGSRVRVLMESRGFRTPFVTRQPTFDHLGMQLDWIYTDSLRAVAYGIIPLRFSDHHAIWVQFVR